MYNVHLFKYIWKQWMIYLWEWQRVLKKSVGISSLHSLFSEVAGSIASPLDCFPRVYAQTSFYQENLAFCFQLCTVTHFVGFPPLPWFSCSLVFFPYSWIRFGRFFVLCLEKKVGGLYLIVCKNYNSLTCLNVFFAIFNFDDI